MSRSTKLTRRATYFQITQVHRCPADRNDRNELTADVVATRQRFARRRRRRTSVEQTKGAARAVGQCS